MEFFNPSAAGRLDTLVGFAAGSHACALERSNADEVRDEVMMALKGMFGSDASEPISMYRTQWHSDPHALGAYPYLAVGGRLSHLVTLSETLDGRIFFAGDGTHPPYIGTAHGAYLSGVKAARAIADTVGSPP
jgi:monoamine oxidase